VAVAVGVVVARGIAKTPVTKTSPRSVVPVVPDDEAESSQAIIFHRDRDWCTTLFLSRPRICHPDRDHGDEDGDGDGLRISEKGILLEED